MWETTPSYRIPPLYFLIWLHISFFQFDLYMNKFYTTLYKELLVGCVLFSINYVGLYLWQFLMSSGWRWWGLVFTCLNLEWEALRTYFTHIMSPKSFLFKIYFIYWFVEEGREKHWFAISLLYAFICWFLYVPCLNIEAAPLAYWDNALTNWATQPGPLQIISLFLLGRRQSL